MKIVFIDFHFWKYKFKFHKQLTTIDHKEQMEPLMLAYPTAGPNFLIGANR